LAGGKEAKPQPQPKSGFLSIPGRPISAGLETAKGHVVSMKGINSGAALVYIRLLEQ